MLNKIKYCLNNENGNPNLENLFGIAFALAALIALFNLGRSLWTFAHDMPDRGSGMTEYKKTIMGYTQDAS